ncbi:MAG TPA: hypothetical protein VET90_06535 [Candidatus Binatus sp.]|nr:hypothetical protein [Candidatus Binatus sp.]
MDESTAERVTTSGFEIRVRGILGDRLGAAFPDLTAFVHGSDTVLTGHLPDQAALHGVLSRIEALGLELVEVRRRDGATGKR